MRIDEDQCVSCGLCIPYCPMNAITMDDIAEIDQDECVDCHCCIRADVCPVDCIIYEEAPWPRSLREDFSNCLKEHKDLKAGRGTEEVKTNEVTGLLKPGWVVLAIEIGRPVVGARFRDVEKITMALVRSGAKFRVKNPVLDLMDDNNTGKLLDEILNEKIMSVIVECIVAEDKIINVLNELKDTAESIDNVFSVGMAGLVDENDEVPVEKLMKDNGILYKPNAKTNLGLGRPLFKGVEK